MQSNPPTNHPFSHHLLLGERRQSLKSVLRQHRQILHADLLPRILKAEEVGALDEVLNLAPVQFHLRQLVQVAVGDGEPVATYPAYEVLPDMTACVDGQVRVGQEQVYS